MNRRGLLRFLAGAAAVAVDPELVAWRPGARVFTFPSIVEPPWICPNGFTVEQLKAIENSLVFNRSAFLIRVPRIGDIIEIRRPPRFDIAYGRGRLG